MKKRIISFILLFIMLFSTTVFAFTDVSEKDWYYNDVTSLQKQGVIAGYDDGTFKPYNKVSNGEALKMIMGIAEIPVGEVSNGLHWASNYYIKALELGILSSNKELDLNQSITRQAVVDIVVNTLKLDNTDLEVKLNNFKDTQDRNTNILANAGIISGVKQEDGFYFKPTDLITRAEMSAVLVRVQNHKLNILKPEPEKDVALEYTDSELLQLGLHKGLSNNEINFVKEPLIVEELEKVLVYMASSGDYEYTIEYKSVGLNQLKNDYSYKERVSAAFNRVFDYYPEYFSLTNQLAYKLSGTESYVNVTFTLENPNFEIKRVKEMRQVFLKEVTNKVIDLVAENKITNEMTQKDKAKVLYDWVILNTEYDKEFKSESFTGYGQVINGKAVCQGYTATYNYMCKLVGLDVYGIAGQAGEEHIWTVAVLDGDKVHIDTTWGDSSSNGLEPNYMFFATNSEFMRKTHKWDSGKFGI